MATPFVKWAGGKAQLLAVLDDLLPPRVDRRAYHEPFLGGGAVFFHIAAVRRLKVEASLSDTNARLIETWIAVREQPRALHKQMEGLFGSHSEESYYSTRARFNSAGMSALERAGSFIYLNKTCFNGLYRENASGEFNVPCGRQASTPLRPAIALLESCSTALRAASLTVAGFDAVLDRADRGDFVYFDPPYVPLTPTASFTAYSRNGFTLRDQERLRDIFAQLDRRGCRVMLSNSSTPATRKLYRGWIMATVPARRAINRDGGARGHVAELVVRNYS